MLTLVLIAISGFAAQLVDGGLGMGFGAASMTILVTFVGLGPASASAAVNLAQLGTTAASGLSHWRFGNVDWRIVLTIGIPGAIGSFVGATVLSHLSLQAARPATATILTGIGIFLLIRFSRGKIQMEISDKPHNSGLLGALGLVGGFISSSGGAGWGPVTTSALMTAGRTEPRRIVGTVSAAEFIVTVAAVIGFVLGLWQEMLNNLAVTMALLVGGVIGAPFAAWAISRLNSQILGGLVGTLLIILNAPTLLELVGIEGAAVTAVRVIVLIVGIGLSILGARRARKNREKMHLKGDSHSETVEPIPSP